MKKGLIALVALVGIAIAAIIAFRVQASLERNKTADVAAPEKPPSVAVAIVEKKEMPEQVAFTGVIRARNEAIVFAKMPGRAARVVVEVGQAVKEGDTLAQLEAVDLGWRVKQAEAQLKAAQAGLTNAKVQLNSANTSWERAQGLHKKGALSQADYEQAEAGHAMAAAGIGAAEAQVALAEAALGLANHAYSDSRITSPIAGIVARKMIEVGATTGPGQPAFVVQDQGALEMQGTVPASDVGKLVKGAPVKVTVDELPGRTLEGTLATIAPTLEQESRRALVEVSLAPTEGLMPYMFGHADIGVAREPASGDGAAKKDGEVDAAPRTSAVLVVPASAVLPTADGAVVWAVRDGKAVKLKPTLGGRVDDEIIVVAGIEQGERVIVSGDTGIKEGIAVTVTGG
jgi:RND family efflux transporter MFP subunit